jgi:hypothetical protein
MEPPRTASPEPRSSEAVQEVGPLGWEDYRAARARFLRTLQIDSLDRLVARSEADRPWLGPEPAR